MDKTALYLERQPRRFPGPPPLQIVGVLPRKADHVDAAFDTFNYSFIIRGSGFFRCEDEPTYEVHPPCFMAKRVGPAYHYGPNTTWTECYLKYAADDQEAFASRGLLPHDDRPRPLHPQAMDLLTEFMRECSRPTAVDHPDRLDRLAERLLMEAWSLTETVRSPSSGHAAVLAMRDRLREEPEVDHDLAALARAVGCSPGYARRLWQRYLGTNPASYIAELRHTMACELLLMTNDSIAAVAKQVGYHDPQYFSRRFRAFAQCSPSEWRRRQQGEE